MGLIYAAPPGLIEERMVAASQANTVGLLYLTPLPGYSLSPSGGCGLPATALALYSRRAPLAVYRLRLVHLQVSSSERKQCDVGAGARVPQIALPAVQEHGKPLPDCGLKWKAAI